MRTKLTLNIQQSKPSIADKTQARQQLIDDTLKQIEKDYAIQQNLKAKRLKQEQLQAAKKFLQFKFPTVFNRQNPMPLKINIHIDIFNDPNIIAKINLKDFTKTVIRETITSWCRSKKYHQALLKHDNRYDLNCSSVAIIDKEHKKKARNIINKLIHSHKQTK